LITVQLIHDQSDTLLINKSTTERCLSLCPSDSVKGDERPRQTR